MDVQHVQLGPRGHRRTHRLPPRHQQPAPTPSAVAIIEKHSRYLVRAAVTIADRLGFTADDEVCLVLCGGILEHAMMARLVGDEVRKRLPRAKITHPLVDPAHGAALLAMTQARKAGTAWKRRQACSPRQERGVP